MEFLEILTIGTCTIIILTSIVLLVRGKPTVSRVTDREWYYDDWG